MTEAHENPGESGAVQDDDINNLIWWLVAAMIPITLLIGYLT